MILTAPDIKGGQTSASFICYHCGEICDGSLHNEEKAFCCNGCYQVYLLLNENNLCNYYALDKNPGLKARGKFTSERFAYLDDDVVIAQLVQFSNDTQTNITFSLPQIHCSSCVFLLENLHRINPGILSSTTNFQRKEVFIVFEPSRISLRKVVELLSFVGYEPAISLNDTVQRNGAKYDRSQIYKIGVAGFCFVNIMMLSFPEYFSSGKTELQGLSKLFTGLNFVLSLPVLFFSAMAIFVPAWQGLRQRFLNIDAPIALAILVTFGRSYYEILSGTGAGYLDSGTGIIFFMLVGRWFQHKTYDAFSFDRDYRSYFPLGVNRIEDGGEKNVPITRLKKGDRILLRNQEMVPADAILTAGTGNIDYSFVSGENTPVAKHAGQLVYAGGKQMGAAIELTIVKEASQSYITGLWNNDVFANRKNKSQSFIHPWSRYFTLALFAVAFVTGVYWWLADKEKILPAVTAVLIVACPCSLLLSATFTYGNMLRIFGRNKLYLKNAGVIQALSMTDSIVFDKTGTITENRESLVKFIGAPISCAEESMIKSVVSQSTHPLSKVIGRHLASQKSGLPRISNFHETMGKGIEATVNATLVKIGSLTFVGDGFSESSASSGTAIHVSFDHQYKGRFVVENSYREGVSEMADGLKKYGYDLSLLSGDDNQEKIKIGKLMGEDATIKFQQTPLQKMAFIKQLQQNNHRVMMVGDGLNDAGALMQSDVGIAVSDDTSQFSPACDAILDGGQVKRLASFMAFARSGKAIVMASFMLSILYNVVGLSFAVQGTLSPVIAAILMPVSSVSIVLFVIGVTSLGARLKGL